MEDYLKFYKGILGFSPYKFQERVAELLLNGKNVILSVPTGAGKTWASIMPFLYAKHNRKENFPVKMIYSLPLRTLTNSIYNDINELMSNEKTCTQYPDLTDLISIQTGEYCNDPYFEKEIVFSTIDQTLSNFLCFPLALSQNQANINAGSIIGSYLVFDEFHLLDPKLSMATTIGMIKILKNLCRVCIMTATLTDDFIQYLKKELQDFEIVSIKDFPVDVPKINSLRPADDKTIKKAIHTSDNVLNVDDILKCHKNKTIVICNRVETAQRIFLDLKKKKQKTTDIICIHSRFFDSDRKEKESLIKEYFGKNSKKSNVILVATQVIEAGMDISCDVMFTEISPINSFLQRAGRCARFAKEYGDIFICDVLSLEEKEIITIDDLDEGKAAEIKKINNKYLPYDKDLCQESLNKLNCYDHIDEEISSLLVNEVLQKQENSKANNISSNRFNKDIIYESWLDCDKIHYKDAIRNIESIEIILFDVDSYQNEKIAPRRYEAISIYKWSFIGWIKRNLDFVNEDDWIIAKAESSLDSSFDDDWQDKNDFYLRYLDVSQLPNYYDVVFVNNKYFDYNDAGFIMEKNRNGMISPLKPSSDERDEDIVFHKDTYYEHSKALLNCFQQLFEPKSHLTFSLLNEMWGKQINWCELIKFTICLHDYGKLNAAWQKPMLDFQRKKLNDDSYFEVIAHTDYNENTDMELSKTCKIKQKPPHAGIGAFQAYYILEEIYGKEIARIVGCAILKHHGIKTGEFKTFSISKECLSEAEKIIKDIDFDCKLIQRDRGETLHYIIPPKGKDKEWMTYLIFVRILRLCDQKATESKDKYYKL